MLPSHTDKLSTRHSRPVCISTGQRVGRSQAGMLDADGFLGPAFTFEKTGVSSVPYIKKLHALITKISNFT